MSQEPRNPVAAGAPLALIIIAGALVGGMLGQPIVGILIGVGIGTAIAVAVWLGDRRRNRD